MTKIKFLLSLNEKLKGLPQDDVEERLNFYSEMIEDRMEEGLSEEDAVSAVGSVDDIAKQIKSEISSVKISKNEMKPKRRMKAWEIVLLALGAPIWISLIIAAIAVFLSLYLSLWSVIVSLWAIFASLIACAIGGIIAGIVFAFHGNGLTGMAIVGASLICTGLAIFLCFCCKAATKGTLLLTKKSVSHIKNCFTRKEEA